MVGHFSSNDSLSKNLVELLLEHFFSCLKNQERFLKEFPKWKQYKNHYQRIIQGSTLAKVADSKSLARKRLVSVCIEDNLFLREISLLRGGKLGLEKKRITKREIKEILNCFSAVEILWEIIAERLTVSKEVEKKVLSQAEIELEKNLASREDRKVKKSLKQRRVEPERLLIRKLEKKNQQLESKMELISKNNIKLQEELKKEKKMVSDLENKLSEVSGECCTLRKRIKELERQLRRQERQIKEYKEKIKDKKKVIKELSSRCDVCEDKDKAIITAESVPSTKNAFQCVDSSISYTNKENPFMRELKRELAKEETKKRLKRAQSRLGWLEHEIYKYGKPERIIVDGHNLLLKGGYINSSDRAFEPAARERLKDSMGKAAIRMNCRTILVFDTKYRENFVSQELLEVVYWPKRNGGADRYILNEVNALNSELVLVFSDDQNHIGREVVRLQSKGKNIYCFGVELICNYLIALEKLNQLKKNDDFSVQNLI